MPEPEAPGRLARFWGETADAWRSMDVAALGVVYVRNWRVTVPLTVLAFVVAIGLAGSAVFAYDYSRTSVPPPGRASIASPTVIVDAAGDPVRRLEPAVVGEEVAAADLPEHIVDAVLAAEDRGFFDHGGFSVRGTLRALVQNVRSGEVEQGGSTITQQYVDLTTPGAAQSYRTKFREVAAAVRYERHLGKDEILSRYLNVVPFGRDTTGIDAAAQVYFDVPAADLDLNQAATLAGMIAAPSAFDLEDNPEDARRRRDTVIEAMVEEGWLSQAEGGAVTTGPLPEVRERPLVDHGPEAYFVDAVRRRLAEVLPEQDLSRGYVVHTTLDQRMQQQAQAAVAHHVGAQPYTGAAVLIDPATGGVRALVGGADFDAESYNAAVQSLRQPGSAFKPFTLAAFVDAGYSPDRSRFPAPREIEVEVPGEDVTVENFGGQSFGELDVREATERSVNTVYMQLVEAVGPEQVKTLAEAAGVRGEVPAVPSIALGSASVSPLHLASGYATFAAEGVYREPHLVTRVLDAQGREVYAADPAEEQAVSPQVAGLVTDVLAGVVAAGTGTAADIGRPVAGKTGTTDDSRDAWFAGYTPQLAAAVWVGMADNSPMNDATGGALAAPIWADIMREALAPLPPVDLPTAGDDGLEAFDATPPDPSPEPPDPPTEPPSPEPTGTAPTSPEPTETDPEPTDPEPTETEPEPTEPEPTETEPEPTEPEPTEPEPTEPEPTEPEPTETEPEPTETEPEPTDTQPTQTEPTETTPTATGPSEPEPTGTEPTSPEPTGTEPTSSEPTSSESAEPSPTASG